MNQPAPTALIAEDEPLLAQALQAELAQVWPELQVVTVVGDGEAAVQCALQHQPDVLFFDVRMPGLSGLDAATRLADEWPHEQPGARPFPALVFVTAYDQYAVQAFDAQAVDYLLKPVEPARLHKTVGRVRETLAARSAGAINFEATLGRLRGLLQAGAAPATSPLRLIQASAGSAIRMVPVDEVLYFEAADKYVRVLTVGSEYLIRTPLRDLLPQLDPQTFWQVHRGTVVRATAIDEVTRDDSGRLSLRVRGRGDRLAVSRLYAHLFRAM